MNRQLELMANSDAKGQKRFLFFLQSSSGFLACKFAPDGWKDAKFSIERNLVYMGLTRKLSVNELTFVKDARDFIQNAYETIGITAKIQFIVMRLGDSDQLYRDYFRGLIDLSTYVVTETGVKVGVIDTSMTEKLKNREKTKVNVRQRTSINGYTIPPFTNELPYLTMPSFSVVLSSAWNFVDFMGDSSTILTNHFVPLTLSLTDFTEAQSQTIAGTDPMFLNSAADRPIHIEANIQGSVSDPIGNIGIVLRLFVDGVEYKNWYIFLTGNNPYPFLFLINEDIIVTTGNDISFQMEVGSSGDPADRITNYSYCFCHITQLLTPLLSSYINGQLLYETILRNLQIILDDYDVLQSEYFGRTDSPVITYAADGHLGWVTKGTFLRGAGGLNNTLSICFSDLFKSLSSLFGVGMGIETVGGKEKVVIESLDHFFGSTVICDLSSRIREAAISKEVLPDWHYNLVKVGYGTYTYENTGGLLEFNTESNFSTVISALDNELELISPYRGDTSGMNKSRLQGVNSEDCEGDEDIFIIDTVRRFPGLAYWNARTDEGFSLVEGGPGAGQFYNLDWAPKRNLLRNGIRLRAGLNRDLGSSVRWQSTEKNSTLATQLTTETLPVVENADILVNDLEEPLWYAEAYNFECVMNYTDLSTILANPNGLIKLSATKYGWILKLELGNKENKAKIQLLRCNLNKVIPV